MAGYETYLLVADGLGDAKVGDVHVLDVGTHGGRFQRMLVCPWRLLKRALQLRASIYHFHDPELLLIALGLKKHGAKIIYDSHEDVPRAILSRDWIPLWARHIISGVFETFEIFVARRLSCVVGATPFIAEKFERARCRAIAINNFPMPADIRTDTVERNPTATICFLGGISGIRGVREIITALEPLDTMMVLAGPFDSDETRKQLMALPGWANIDYKGNLDRKTAVKIMGESAVGMICYLPEPNHINSYPNKLFEYMAAELPVIASNFPLWRQIVEGAQCGICVDPENPAEIRQAIIEIMRNPGEWQKMGERGRKAVQERYNWESEEKKLFRLYESLIGGEMSSAARQQRNSQ